MASETLIFMPNGDVTLTLTRHVFKEENIPSGSSPTLVNGTSAVEQKQNYDLERPEASTRVEPETPAEELEEDVLFFAPDPPGGDDGPLFPPPPRAARGSDASSRRDRSASPPASFWASLKRQQARLLGPEDEKPASPLTPAKKPERTVISSHEVSCVVSSRHMMLASRHFQTILSGNFNEAITLQSKGHVTIPLSDDFDAMIVLLNIIHGASRKVPRQVSLEELSKLAVLVSRFEILETVEFFSDTWIDNLKKDGLPRSYNENVLPLLYVFWVFDRASEFKDMARLAQRECNETLNEDAKNIPLQHSVIDAIKRDREFAIETAITVIHALINRYMEGQTICDGSLDDELRYACDAMVLGSLLKSSRKIGIWPKPEAPFNGRKFKDLARAIRSIRILDVCNKSSSRRWVSHGPSNNCHGLEDSIEESMKSIEAGLDGLELADYPKKRENYEPEFQSFLATPPKNEAKEQTKEFTNENHLQPEYPKEKTMQLPKEELKIVHPISPISEPRHSLPIDLMKAEQPVKQPEQTQKAENPPRLPSKGDIRSSMITVSREAEQPVQEGVKLGPQQYSMEKIQKQETPAQEEVRASARPLPNQFQYLGTPAPEEGTASPRQSPSRFPFQQPEAPAPENAKASPRQPPFHHTETPAREEPRVSLRQNLNPFQQPQVYASEEPKAYSKPYSNSFQQPEVPAREEARASPRQYSNPFQQPEISAREEVKASSGQYSMPSLQPETYVREEVKASPKQYSSPFPSHQPEISTREEAKAVSREHSRESQRLEAPISRSFPSYEVKEPTKDLSRTSSRDSSIQEIRALTKEALQKSAEELRREDMKAVRSREEVKSPTERTPSRTPPTLYPQIHAVKAPVVADIHLKTIHSTERKIEEVVLPVKEDSKSNRVSVTTDGEETWAPPKNIRMKKSKKTFSTRY